MTKNKLSIVLATRNEEENIVACIESAKEIADEIIVVDEESGDNTVNLAKKMGANVFTVKHEDMFHKSKQKALDYASGDWILQLDADERLTKGLAEEIVKIIKLSSDQIKRRRPSDEKQWRLFQNHQFLIEQRETALGRKTGEVVAFFIPRVNFFLGKPLMHAGLYPDGVIRLIKKGKARFPTKTVHELMDIDGEVAWLFNNIKHHDSPTLERYLERANRYTSLSAEDFKSRKVNASYLNLFYYSFIKPVEVFSHLFFLHKGFLDGMRGFIWSLFSALHFPIAYFKYWQMSNK